MTGFAASFSWLQIRPRISKSVGPRHVHVHNDHIESEDIDESSTALERFDCFFAAGDPVDRRRSCNFHALQARTALLLPESRQLKVH